MKTTLQHMYPKELKDFNLVCLSLYRILKLKWIDRRHFLGKRSVVILKIIYFCLKIINFQILPALSLKNNLHRRSFRSNFYVNHFPFCLKDCLCFQKVQKTYSEPFQTYFKYKMELFAKIAIGYFGKKLHLRCLIGNVI